MGHYVSAAEAQYQNDDGEHHGCSIRPVLYTSCGALNWKNTLRGRVAACVRQLAADRTNHILYREAEEIAHRLMAHRNCLLIATSLLKSTRSILLITTRICGMPSSGNDYHTGSKEHTIHLV